MIFKNVGFPIHVDALKMNPKPELHEHLDFKYDYLQMFDEDRVGDIPRISVEEEVVTPRQLMESSDFYLKGVLEGKG
jgi:hypothetical protein